MYIHIGDKKTVSDTSIIGIFSTDTILKSDMNSWIKHKLNENFKVIAIGNKGEIMGSSVSPYTIINRKAVNKDDLIWSNYNG